MEESERDIRMIEIRVLPDGKLWTWKLRLPGGCWLARKNTSRKDKCDVRKSAKRFAEMLSGEGVKVKLELGPVRAYRCGHGVKVVAIAERLKDGN